MVLSTAELPREHGQAYQTMRDPSCAAGPPAWRRSSGRAYIPGKAYRHKSHHAILRLQGLNALGNVAVINIHTVDIHKVPKRCSLVPGRFVGGGKLVVQGDAGL